MVSTRHLLLVAWESQIYQSHESLFGIGRFAGNFITPDFLLSFMNLVRLKPARPRSAGHLQIYTAKPCCRPIHTVHRPSLSPEDYVDVSGYNARTLSCPGPSSAGFKVQYHANGTFPPGSAGFFYYDPVDVEHPVCGQLRFRVTGSPDPATFETGRDLLNKYGGIWAVLLPSISGSPQYKRLAELLIAEGLVTQKVLGDVVKFQQKLGASYQIVSSGKRSFVARFANSIWTLRVAKGTELHKIIITNPLVDERFCGRKSPYKGVLSSLDFTITGPLTQRKLRFRAFSAGAVQNRAWASRDPHQGEEDFRACCSCRPWIQPPYPCSYGRRTSFS